MNKTYKCKITNEITKRSNEKFLTESEIIFWRDNGFKVEVNV